VAALPAGRAVSIRTTARGITPRRCPGCGSRGHRRFCCPHCWWRLPHSYRQDIIEGQRRLDPRPEVWAMSAARAWFHEDARAQIRTITARTAAARAKAAA
jgi:hypothetical protein